MLTKARKKINIITLGCSKNLVDSEQMAMQLQANDFDVAHEREKVNYDIAIINTCGFIASAKEESIENILHQVELKKKKKIEKVYVTGCLSERYKQDLENEIPDVDAFFGTMELQELLQTMNADYKTKLLGERLLSTPKHYAYLKISEGCNRTCSFCAIPLMRGKHLSKTIETIVEEAKQLVQTGTKEILLIAQELTYYGLDIYKKRSLPDLLEQLTAIQGLKWIRLHYAYPSLFPIDIIQTMAKHDNICKYLDMPLQHASDAVLQRMKRQITLAEMRDLLNKIRSIIPTIILRTTFLIGFPGETDEDIDVLCAFMEEQQFDRVGVFQYSHEENTSAHGYVDDVSESQKQERYERIMNLQQEISTQKNLAKVDQTLCVLIDKKEAGKYIGRTEDDSPEVDNEVIVNSTQKLTIGNFYNVKITKSYDYDLEGVVANSSPVPLF